MDELLKKISNYQILNYIIPGVLGAFLIDELNSFSFKLIQQNIVICFFVYYLIGSIINRLGAMFIAPLLTIVLKIKKAPYKLYIRAEKIDPKIEVLSEIQSMYRSFCALFLIVFIFTAYDSWINKECKISLFLLLFLFCIYSISYKTQTNFIRKRVIEAIRNNRSVE